MYTPDPNLKFKYIPLDQLDDFSKLNTKDLVTFHYTDFNEAFAEAVIWNNRFAGQTNTEIRFRLDAPFMVAYLHRFGM
jgi:hypothetical protein